MGKDTDEGMSKYGVQLDEEKQKEAMAEAIARGCPICLEELDNAGACPVHGTEPLEPLQPRKHR